MKEDQDDRFGDEEPTKPGNHVGAISRVLRDFSVAYSTAYDDLRETARLIDGLPPDERSHRLRELATKLGRFGDIAHEARFIINGLSQTQG